ncbi:HAD-IIA family hydrolase [Metabacillus halosaccharovorans]|uniref:HAD-IIA family hydrolase n=1 Tax=Metabacillus halosaccharovorans TaxID=930124 RepID=UPI00203BAB03|nr:HAD-IIA family hydrolase [Metabacillus halosaccharovorans]MCM3443125.1 HAD-IIA family hydrolase [Metabacillus halosaccharovorans]
MLSQLLNEKKAFLFDLDGCIYHGERVAPGAVELLKLLREAQKHIRFITNNSTENSSQIQEKLEKFGIAVSTREVISTTDYIGKYLVEEYGIQKVKVIGSKTLQTSICSCGHEILQLDNNEQADVIIIGRDVNFTYEKLKALVNSVTPDTRIIGTNPDTTHPGMNGQVIPETGSLVASVEAILSQKTIYFGKPSSHLFKYGMESCLVQADECVMVGDNYSTDIIGANELGITSIWLNDSAHQSTIRHKEEIETKTIIKPNIQSLMSDFFDLV